MPHISAHVKGQKNINTEETRQLKDIGQSVVNDIQIQQLGEMIEILKNELDSNRQSKKYFLLIDNLDDGWIDDDSRLPLIRALIEIIRAFVKIQNLRIVMAIRSDLLEMVYRSTRSSGFQSEKYRDLNAEISWNSDDIILLVERRIQNVLKDQYTSKAPQFHNVFTQKIGEKKSRDYFIERTLKRPRDAIAFFNNIIEENVKTGGNLPFTSKQIQNAETHYSNDRRNALADEWRDCYPEIDIAIDMLKALPPRFHRHEIPDNVIDNMIMAIIDKFDKEASSKLVPLCHDYFSSEDENHRARVNEITTEWLKELYRVGVITIRQEADMPYQHSSDSTPIFTGDIPQEAYIVVHQILRSALGQTKKPKGMIILP